MIGSPLSIVRFKILFSVTWWTIAIMDITFLQNLFGLSFREALTDGIVTNVLLILFCLLIINTLRFYLPRNTRYLNILVWCLLLTGIWIALQRWLLLLIWGSDETYVSFLGKSLIIRAVIGFLLLGCVTLLSILWYNWQDLKEKEKRERDAEKLAKDAELFKLRQQLQPHFLFNSLNSINALISIRPEEARKMIQQLSDFLRGTIRKEENQLISFSEELEYLKLYLEIEKVRFGYRLKTEMDISEESLTWKIPSLLLQPLMENAIKFGLYGTTGDVTIGLRASVIDKYLVIAVMNPYDADMQMPEGTGFGLNSVKRRLYLLFARNDLVEINKEKNSFVVVIKIPANE